MRKFTGAGLAVVMVLLVAIPASAQDSRQRAAAAEAYDRGTSGYMTGEYADAAQWFETAHRLAPAPAALMQAIRAHQKAENLARAATLAVVLQNDYPGEAQAVQYADQILAETAPSLLRVDVDCSACEIDLDEAVQQARSLFVDPDTSHVIVAHFATGDVTKEISGSPGQTTTLRITAPAARLDAPAQDPEDPAASGGEDSSGGGLPPLVTFIGAGVTGAFLIATIISGVDTNAGVDAYEKAARSGAPNARKLLADGESKETRTNVLIGVTAVFAVATGVIAGVLTDWSSEEEADTHAAIIPTADGVMGFVESRF
jgi:hypothetical protein